MNDWYNLPPVKDMSTRECLVYNLPSIVVMVLFVLVEVIR